MYMGSENATHKESYMLRKIGSGSYTGVQQTAQGGTIFTYGGNADVTHHQDTHVFEYLDSPNTTDEIIYKVQTGYTNGQWDYRVNTSEQGESQDDFHCVTAISTLTVMEIVA